MPIKDGPKPYTTSMGVTYPVITGFDVEGRTGKEVLTTFNYRYSPYSATVNELLHDGLVRA